MRMQLVELFICGLERMKMEMRFPTNPRAPTLLSRIPGRKNSKTKESSSFGGSETVWFGIPVTSGSEVRLRSEVKLRSGMTTDPV